MAYTWGQFQRDRAAGKVTPRQGETPSQHYKRIIDWQASTRRKRAASKAAAAFPGQLTVQQMRQAASQQAQAMINAEVNALNAGRGLITREGTRLANQEMLAAGGLAQALGSISPQIQGIYNTAGSELAGVAGNYSDAVRDLLTTDTNAANQTLANLELPTGLESQAGNVRDVLFAPSGDAARSTITSGRDFAAAAAMLPGTARLTGLSYAAQRRQAAQDQLAELAAQVAAAKGKRGSYFQEALGNEREYQSNLYDQWIKGRAQDLYEKQYGAEVSKTMGRDPYGNLLPGYTLGPNGEIIPPGYVYDAKTGTVVKPKTSSSSSQAAKRHAAALKKMGEEFARTRTRMAAGLKSMFTKDSITGATIPPSWSAARTRLWNVWGKGLLRFAAPNGRAALEQRIMAMIDEILEAHGISKPTATRPDDQGGPRGPGAIG